MVEIGVRANLRLSSGMNLKPRSTRTCTVLREDVQVHSTTINKVKQELTWSARMNMSTLTSVCWNSWTSLWSCEKLINVFALKHIHFFGLCSAKSSLTDAAVRNAGLVLRTKLHLADVAKASILPTQQTTLEIQIGKLPTQNSWHLKPGTRTS